MHCVALLERDEMLEALDGHLAAALAFAARHEAARVAIEAPHDANTMPR
jgi:hypothetical protein